MRWSRRSTSVPATVQLNDIPRYIFYHEEEAGERQEQWPMPEHMGASGGGPPLREGVDCPCAGAEPDGYGGRGEAEADPAGTSIQDDEVPSQRIGL